MAKDITRTTLAAALGAGLVVGAAQAEPVQSATNPFGASVFEPARTTVAAAAAEEEGKDGEHQCGAEGKCGSEH